MYKLYIKFKSGKEMTSNMNKADAMKFLKTKSKKPVAWAKLTWPDGSVTKDVTKYIQQNLKNKL